MIVVGGTYREVCREPQSDTVFGSGLRAAAALSGSGTHRFVTWVDSELEPAARGTAAAFGVAPEFRRRERPVAFYYDSPLSPPGIDGLGQGGSELDLDFGAGNALVFGTLEVEPTVRAAGIVFDPQRPRGPQPIDRSRLAASRFALVANSGEARALAQTTDLREAAAKLASETQAEVVVLKRGALGALVHEGGTTTPVGPYRTDVVWPIGSGDVFSAVFAWAWLEDKRPAVEAARLASAGASAWCGLRRLPLGLRPGCLPEDVACGTLLPPREDPVRVYLAGPFFDAGERWLVNLAYNALVSLGASVFSPLHDVGLGGDEVAQPDIDGLVGSDAVLGLLDGADAGTLFEMGYAAARSIPQVGYAEHPKRDEYKMIRGLGAHLTSDLSTAVYRAIWAGMNSQ
jgi:nucleoside 2-deoxyribosyltransferase